MSDQHTITLEELGRAGPARVTIREDWSQGAYGLFLYTLVHTPGGTVKRHLRVDNIVVTPDDKGFFPPQPPILLDKMHGGVQELMDDLWHMGIRPTFRVEPEAQRAHLEHVTRLLDLALPKALRP